MIRALKVAKYFPSLELIIWRKIVWWSKMWNLEQSSSRYLRYSPVIPICDILLKWSKSYKLIIFCFSVIQSSFYLIGTQANRQNKTNILRQADRKGGGSAPSALIVSKCENLDPFFHWNFIHWHSKHILSQCEESQKCIFHALFVVVKMRGHMGILRVYDPLIKNERKCTLTYTPPYWQFLE